VNLRRHPWTVKYKDRPSPGRHILPLPAIFDKIPPYRPRIAPMNTKTTKKTPKRS
jgi:hypothetical protein